MFELDDLGDVVGGPLGVGIAAGAVIVMVGGRRGRPLLKGALKGYLAATRRVREWTAEAGEQLQDVYAEAKHEMQQPASPLVTASGGETVPSRRRTPPATAEQPA